MCQCKSGIYLDNGYEQYFQCSRGEYAILSTISPSLFPPHSLDLLLFLVLLTRKQRRPSIYFNSILSPDHNCFVIVKALILTQTEYFYFLQQYKRDFPFFCLLTVGCSRFLASPTLNQKHLVVLIRILSLFWGEAFLSLIQIQSEKDRRKP